MKRTLVLAGVLALIAASPAVAKEVTAVAVCGAQRCDDVAIPQGLNEFPGGGQSVAPPPPAGGFVEVVLTYDRTYTERLWYVPAARLFAIRDDAAATIRWLPVGTHELDRLIEVAASGVAPYRPRATDALIDGERVQGDVSGYLDLFGVESAGAVDSYDMRYSLVSLKTTPTSPWALTPLWFYPDQGLLQRGNETITLPAGIADDLRAARPIDASSTGGGFDWPLVTGSLVVAFALLLTAILLSRRGRQPRPA